MQTPFFLDKGLHLEKADIVLPWGASLHALKQMGQPSEYRYREITNLWWENETVFGGLPVRVDVQGAVGRNTFFLDRTQAVKIPADEYSTLLEALTQRVGPPHSLDNCEGNPRARWLWGSVHVSLRRSSVYDLVAFVVSLQTM